MAVFRVHKTKNYQIYLQPKIGLRSGRLEGAEALVRWNHPQKGIIYPSDFIPLFENNGKICRLDLYVFTEVCAAIDRWRQEGLPLIPVSVNLSRQHFRNPNFLDTFAGIASSFKIPDKILEFELTAFLAHSFLYYCHVSLGRGNIQSKKPCRKCTAWAFCVPWMISGLVFPPWDF